MSKNIQIIKKQIIYRCRHTGIKESYYIYQKTILKNLNKLNFNDLSLLIHFFNEISELDIINILNKKKKIQKKYNNTIRKIIDD